LIKNLIERTRKSWRASANDQPDPSQQLPLRLSSESRATIEREVASFSRNLETGGILIGQTDSTGLIRVTHASGPGPNAVHQPSYFLRDTEYCAKILRDCYDETGSDYVGEWHSHVGRLNHPSAGDLLTLSGIMSDPDYDFDVFAMVIAVKAGRIRSRRIRLNGFIATKALVHRVTIVEP
jgi:integrative and conjugative element protein (TIGR02256 family)